MLAARPVFARTPRVGALQDKNPSSERSMEMSWKLPILALFAPLLFVACDESGEVEVGGAEARGEVQIEEQDVFRAARNACNSLPLKELSDELGIETTNEEALADRFAQPWPDDVRATVREGCLEGLQESAAAGQ